MLAVVFQDGAYALADRPKPAPAQGEVLIRTLVAGICNTDVELLKGYMNFSGTPGHEFVGVVEAAPPGSGLLGKRVVADINIGCAACPRCQGADARHCPNRTTLGIKGKDGAFAQYFTIPAANCLQVPDGLPDTLAVFAEPLAAALEVGQQLHITARTRLAVLGDGKLGLLAAMGLRHLCPGLVLVGKHADKMAVAARHGVQTASADSIASLGLFDVVVEATGRPQGLDTALNMVRPEGVIVLKSTTEAQTCLNMARVVVDEITLMGSRCGDIGLALDHLAHGLVDPSGLVEAEHPFADFDKAFARASRPGARKVLLRFD